MKVKKMIALGLGSLLLGGLAFGMVGCAEKVPVEQYDALQQQLKQAQDQLNAAPTQAQIDQLESEKDAAEQRADAAEATANNTQVQLDEKDQELLAYEKQVADKADLEQAEAKANEEAVDDLSLGESVPATRLDSDDLSFLSEGETEVNDEEYDYEEAIYLDGLSVAVSSTGDEEFSDTPYLTFAEAGAVRYAVEFQEPVPASEVSEDEPLSVPFLGRTLTVVDIDGDEVTYKEASKHLLAEGESVQVGNHTVTLKVVTDGKVYVEVDGSGKSVSEGNTVKIGTLQVRAKEVLYRDFGRGLAELEVGEDVLKTVSDGEDFVDDDDTYAWNVNVEDGELQSLGVSFNVKVDDFDDEDGKVLAPKDTFVFKDYFDLTFDLEEDYKATTYSFSFDEVTNEDVKVVKVQSSEERGLVVGDERLKTAYLAQNGTVFYKEDGDWKQSSEPLVLKNKDTERTVSYDNESGAVAVGDDVAFFSLDFEKLGVEQDEAESTDVFVYGTAVGEREESILLTDGTVVKSVESNAEKDEVEVVLLSEEAQAKLLLKKR